MVGAIPWPLINRESRHVIGVMANVVAGERYSPPNCDAIVCDVAAPEKPFRSRCPIRAHFGSHQWELRKGFAWNGADIPRLVEWLIVLLLGVSRFDPRVVLASGFHDDICEQANAGRCMRAIGDAIFISLLMPIAFNGKELGGVGALRAVVLYAGVRSYSICRFVGRKLKDAEADAKLAAALFAAIVFAYLMFAW